MMDKEIDQDTPRAIAADRPDGGPNTVPDTVPNTTNRPPASTTQEKFDERTQFFMGHFQTICESEHVPAAIAIVRDPKIQGGPLLYCHGSDYEVAKLLAKALRLLKDKLFSELQA